VEFLALIYSVLSLFFSFISKSVSLFSGSKCSVFLCIGDVASLRRQAIPRNGYLPTEEGGESIEDVRHVSHRDR